MCETSHYMNCPLFPSLSHIHRILSLFYFSDGEIYHADQPELSAEDDPVHRLNVTASDGILLSEAHILTVRITESTNRNIPYFNPDFYNMEVPSNLAVGDYVGPTYAYDDDEGSDYHCINITYKKQ